MSREPRGLRDYHTALWVGATRVGARSFDDLAAAGIIAAAERQAVVQAYEFLLRVRTDLHFAQQRKTDVLAIEVQADTAARLGYDGIGTGLPVEAHAGVSSSPCDLLSVCQRAQSLSATRTRDWKSA